MEQELVLSKEAIKRGFRIENGLVVKYVLGEEGKLLRKRKNWRNSIRSKSRQYIKDRCERCGYKSNLSIHHIVNLSNGGNGDKDNCKTLCLNCHNLIHHKPKKIKIKIKKVKKIVESSENVLTLEIGLWGEYRIID